MRCLSGIVPLLQRGPAQRTGRSYTAWDVERVGKRLQRGPAQRTGRSSGPGAVRGGRGVRFNGARPRGPGGAVYRKGGVLGKHTLQRGPAQRTGRSNHLQARLWGPGGASTGPGPEDREEPPGARPLPADPLGFHGARPSGPGGDSLTQPQKGPKK